MVFSDFIHDNSGELKYFPYDDYGIKGVAITPYSPNMNAYTERVLGSIRRESLDNFLLFSEKQVRKIILEYVEYYNHQRPHQGINTIPDGKQIPGSGNIKKNPILGGLHHNYYRSSA